MATRRFYSPDIQSGRLPLDDEQAAHARRVLRLDVGDSLELFDGAGTVATARVVESGRRLVVEVIERHEAPRPRPWIDLAVAVPKGPRADVLVEKASELGADRLVPLLTERSVVDPRAGKLDRFHRLALESAKQCGRNWVMQVDDPVAFSAFLPVVQADVRLIADTATIDSGAESIGDPLGRLNSAERVCVLIGPEGGWTDEERAAAFAAGFVPWRLGPNVLRIETAALAAVAILRHES